jgi:hypothetical protein
MNRTILGWGAWCVLTLLWTAGLVLPVSGPSFGDTESMRHLTRIIIAKTAHVSIYACWAFFTGWLQAPLKVRIFLLMFLMAHAVGTEWCQLAFEHLTGRQGLLRDAALDQFGIFVGVIASFRWWTGPSRER